MTIDILIHDPDSFEHWQRSFAEVDSGIRCLYRGQMSKEIINYALVWNPPADYFADLPDIKAIFSAGAGVDHVLRCQSRPVDVPIVRLSDTTLRNEMSEYILYQVLHFHRNMMHYDRSQSQKEWRPVLQCPPSDRVIGIMGMGALGMHAASQLQAMGFQVRGWSRTSKQIKSIPTYVPEELDEFIKAVDILVSVLPLTKDTENILNQALFNKMKKGSALINVGRGALLNEGDLMSALNDGQLAWACLDVFKNEPLESNHPLWQVSNLRITPHIASQTWPPTAARHIYDNIMKHQRGEMMSPVYDSKRGY